MRLELSNGLLREQCSLLLQALKVTIEARTAEERLVALAFVRAVLLKFEKHEQKPKKTRIKEQ
jgi:hypothetical protein